MSALADKIKAARLSTVDVEGHKYTIRRPTKAEAFQLGDSTQLDVVHQFVVGWDHTELSLGIPGGTGASAPFDADVWAAWVDDQPAIWAPLFNAIMAAYTAHSERQEAAAKN